MSRLHYPEPDLIEGLTHLRKWSLDDVACIEEASSDPRIPALSDVGLARVEAWVEPGNSASRRVLTTAGFVCEGTLRSFLSFPTRRADALVFSRIAAT